MVERKKRGNFATERWNNWSKDWRSGWKSGGDTSSELNADFCKWLPIELVFFSQIFCWDCWNPSLEQEEGNRRRKQKLSGSGLLAHCGTCTTHWCLSYHSLEVALWESLGISKAPEILFQHARLDILSPVLGRMRWECGGRTSVVKTNRVQCDGTNWINSCN